MRAAIRGRVVKLVLVGVPVLAVAALVVALLTGGPGDTEPKPGAAGRTPAADTGAGGGFENYAGARVMSFTGEGVLKAVEPDPGVRIGLAKRVPTVVVTGRTKRRVVAVPVPQDGPGPSRSVLINAYVEVPVAARSASGVFCRGRTDGSTLKDGYVLIVGAAGRWLLARVRDDRTELLGAGSIPRHRLSKAGELAEVQLSCERVRPKADLWFVVRVNEGRPTPIGVPLSDEADVSEGTDVGIAVLHSGAEKKNTYTRAVAAVVRTAR